MTRNVLIVLPVIVTFRCTIVNDYGWRLGTDDVALFAHCFETAGHRVVFHARVTTFRADERRTYRSVEYVCR